MRGHRRGVSEVLSAFALVVSVVTLWMVMPVTGATGDLSTFAGPDGIGDGAKLSARFNWPGGIASYGGTIYVADTLNHRIRKISGGVVSTIAGTGVPGFSGDGSAAISAQLDSPRDVAVSTDGNTIYIADTGNHRIRKIAGGVISTIAGTGSAGYDDDITSPLTATSARINQPSSVAVDNLGNIYVADTANNRIRKIDASADPDTITTIAGNGAQTPSNDSGAGTSSGLSNPKGVDVKSDGSEVYISDTGNNKVLALSSSSGNLTKLAGDGSATTSCSGGADTSKIHYPTVLTRSGSSLYVASWTSNKVCVIDLSGSPTMSEFAGNGQGSFSGDDGPATNASFSEISGLTVDGGIVYIADKGNNRIRAVDSGTVTTFAGSDTWGKSPTGSSAASTRLRYPEGLTIGPDGALYVADMFNDRILRFNGGVSTVVAGGSGPGFEGDGGPATDAKLSKPSGVAVDNAGTVYIADTGNNRIRKVSGGVITTIAGDGTASFSDGGGHALDAQFNSPQGIAVTGDGTTVYVSDTNNSRIRKVTLSVSPASITTIAGTATSGYDDDVTSPLTATSARLNYPRGVTIAPDGSLYVADTLNSRIRRISDGTITTVAGNGYGWYSGDGGSAMSAGLSLPYAVAFDADGNYYISDTNSYRIRRVSLGQISTIAGSGHFGYSGENIPATSSAFGELNGIGVDSAGNVYIADRFNSRVFKIETVASAVVTVPATVTTTVTTTIAATPSPLTVPRKGGLAPKAIATYLSMTTPPGARYTLTVAARSRTRCSVKASKLVSLKTGSCTFTIAVKPKKGVTRKKTTTLPSQ